MYLIEQKSCFTYDKNEQKNYIVSILNRHQFDYDAKLLQLLIENEGMSDQALGLFNFKAAVKSMGDWVKKNPWKLAGGLAAFGAVTAGTVVAIQASHYNRDQRLQWEQNQTYEYCKDSIKAKQNFEWILAKMAKEKKSGFKE